MELRVSEKVDVQSVLRACGLVGARATPIHGGWASWTFDVDGQFILRIARDDEVAEAHRREERLLPALAEAVSFTVPVPIKVGVDQRHTYMLYAKIAGRQLAEGDDLDRLGGMLRELHAFPADRARELLGCPGTGLDWHRQYQESWQWMQRDVLPATDQRAAVTAAYARFVESAADFEPVLVHRDLGIEHILSDDTGHPQALIDFEDATVGDPAIDFAGILAGLGPEATKRVLKSYGKPVSWERVHFYWWMGSAHAVHYGRSTDDTTLIHDAASEMIRRMGFRF